MPAYVLVVRLDSNGFPQCETYLLDKDEDALTVIALIKTFKKEPSQLRVIVEGLRVRGGPDEETKVLRSLHVGDIVPALETAKDVHGNEWVSIAQNELICRVYGGNVKAEYV